jgi:hypothetical protein
MRAVVDIALGAPQHSVHRCAVRMGDHSLEWSENFFLRAASQLCDGNYATGDARPV